MIRSIRPPHRSARCMLAPLALILLLGVALGACGEGGATPVGLGYPDYDPAQAQCLGGTTHNRVWENPCSWSFDIYTSETRDTHAPGLLVWSNTDSSVVSVGFIEVYEALDGALMQTLHLHANAEGTTVLTGTDPSGLEVVASVQGWEPIPPGGGCSPKCTYMIAPPSLYPQLVGGRGIRRLALGLVLALHYAYAAFVAGGFLALLLARPLGGMTGGALRWRWVAAPGWRIAHVAALAFVVVVGLLGVTCPLTWAENTLRPLVGDLPVPPPVPWLIGAGVPPWVFSTWGFATMTALAAVGLLWVPLRRRQAR